MENLIVVLMLGLEPVAEGWVLIVSTIDPELGGIKLFKLNLMNGFFTGRIPTDLRLLNPSTIISTLYSLIGGLKC
jgi:hypothetical protein